MKYIAIAHAERTVDVYGGDNLRDRIAKWKGYFNGDMDGEESITSLILKPEHFPPGTKVTVEVPICPDCGMDYELCQSDNECTFDWEQWVEDQYA